MLFLGLAAVAGIVCIRLGVWQLSRLRERQAENRVLAARSAMPPVPFDRLPSDTAAARYRPVRITGVADYAHEIVVANRSRRGSPGVNLLTPVRVPGRDTAVLVNRGWVYAADGAAPTTSPAPGGWRESDTVTFTGFAGVFPDGPAAAPLPTRPRTVTRATLATVRARVPYPVDARHLVVQAPPDSGRPGLPARIQLPPPTDEGPHFGYAFQWFAFATVAFVGAGIAARHGRRGAGA